MFKTSGLWLSLFAVFFVVLPASISAQKGNKPMTGSAAKGAESAGLQVVPDLEQRLAKFRRVEMPFHSEGLTARELKMVEKLVDASRYLEQIYWRQIDPDALTLYESLAGSKNPKDEMLRRYLWINASRFDLLDNNRPFVGTSPIPPGRAFYPQNLTRDQIEQYVKAHPEKKDEIYGTFTVVRWNGDQLEGIPYHIAFRSFLEPAAKELREAAGLSEDPAFANFLRLRADALLDDDYFKSQLAWLDLKNPKFDVIFAPYETYTDDLLGVKASYGASVLIRNEEESRKLAVYQKYVPDIQDALPIDASARPSKRGHLTPMEVMDAPYRAGDLRHGYQAVADNLPNDPRIHQEKGTKKIFFKNFMDARVTYVVLPIARKLMAAGQAAKASGEGYLATAILHEMAHDLGPAFARQNGKQVDVREAIGPAYSGLEEAKADVVGMFGLKWLVDHGALPKERLEEYYASYVAGIFRTLRFGTGEAHGRAEMMEFSYLSEQRALNYSGGRYSIDLSHISGGLTSLAKELLEMEATGDRARTEAWFTKYDRMPAELKSALAGTTNIPVDINPIFSFKDDVQ